MLIITHLHLKLATSVYKSVTIKNYKLRIKHRVHIFYSDSRHKWRALIQWHERTSALRLDQLAKAAATSGSGATAKGQGCGCLDSWRRRSEGAGCKTRDTSVSLELTSQSTAGGQIVEERRRTIVPGAPARLLTPEDKQTPELGSGWA